MTTLQTDTAVGHRAEELYIWERQARPVMDAIASASDIGPARAVVMGNAGSGKSTMLRELHRLLADRTAHASLLADSVDVSRIPRSHVLLVDDLHLLSAAQVEGVRARSEDPNASLVVASRPWPRIDALTSITRSLERSRPAIVLGHVSRSDVLTYLSDGDRVISSSCVDHILEFTGGVSWLVSEALALHDERDCADDSAHRAVMRDIEERIAHRLDTIPAELRHHIEALCVAGATQSRPLTEHDDVIAQGYAEGLLTRNGQPVPLVRSAVRATIPVGRLIDLSASMADGLARSVAEGDAGYRDWIGGIHDRGHRGGARRARRPCARARPAPSARALRRRAGVRRRIPPSSPGAARRRRGRRATPTSPDRSSTRCRCGTALVDGDRIADTSAAIWSLRGMMRMSDAVYRSLPPIGAESHARATIAAVGVGHAGARRARAPGRSGCPRRSASRWTSSTGVCARP